MKTTRWFIFIVLASAMLVTACAPQTVEVIRNVEVDKAGAAPRAPSDTDAYNDEEQSLTNDATAGGQLRMVIMNATLEIVVADPASSMDTITNMASEMGGYVVSSYLYKTTTRNGDEAPEATVTIRVPAERLTEAMNRIKALVKDGKLDIRNEQVSGQDVTREYTDLSSRLRNLEATEQQLLEIQEAATTTEDIMMVFNQITQVRGEIELIKGQMQYYEESSSLSSISVTLVAQAKVEPISVAGWQPEGIANDAIQALVDAGKWLVEQLIWLVLYVLPIALVIGIPAFFIWRAYRKYARKNAAAQQTAVLNPPQPPEEQK